MAVLDVGKTNVKLLVFGADGAVLRERRTNAAWRQVDGLIVLDDETLFDWIFRALVRAAAELGVRNVMVATHGCTFALLGSDGLTAPILDYEQRVPAQVERDFERMRPPFRETGTPRMTRGFACGKHIVWRELLDPTLAGRVVHIVTYAQFWVWRLCGARVGEISSLGCHTHLWSTARGDFSSLVDRRGWRSKMPPLRRAGEIVGHTELDLPSGTQARIAVHNGVHDSNASLSHYRRRVPGRMALVSTGTWVVVMNPDCPLAALDPARDMLTNVSVAGELIPTVRFMGGREFDLIRGQATPEAAETRVAALIRKGIFALPSFADGGPFPGRCGGFTDAEGDAVVVPDPSDRAALATLYVVLMTDIALGLIRSDDAIVFDGGLARIRLIPRLLAALRTRQRVLVGGHAEGTASGAAGIAFDRLGHDPFRNQRCHVVPGFDPVGWRDYAARWKALSATRQHAPGDPAGDWTWTMPERGPHSGNVMQAAGANRA